MMFTKSLHKKWLEITKHPLKNGCLEYQEFNLFFATIYASIARWFKSWPNFIPDRWRSRNLGKGHVITIPKKRYKELPGKDKNTKTTQLVRDPHTA